MNDIVFISDLHLAPERPEIINIFRRFADEIAARADSLYILGDFLEYWLGDDDPAIALSPVFEKLIELDEKHATKVFFMHGNRDFLIGADLAQHCHFNIISEPHRITIHGHDTLLMHGDTLCTDDIEYQNFRSMVRSTAWQQQILDKSIDERIQIAKDLREKSQQSTAEKAEYIMDVNQRAVDKTFADNHIDLLIHGHTHRPKIHQQKVNGINTTRIVLGDWHHKGSYLRINNNAGYEAEFRLQVFE